MLVLTERLAGPGLPQDALEKIMFERGYARLFSDLWGGRVIDRTQQPPESYEGNWHTHPKKDWKPDDFEEAAIVWKKGEETPLGLYRVDTSRLF